MTSQSLERSLLDSPDHPYTVLDYYSDRYRHSTRDQWRDRILQGQVLLAGQPCHPDMPLQVGQHLAYHRPPWQEPSVPLAFEVLYEDDDLMVVSKPSGLPVLPGAGFLEHTLLGQLQRHYGQRCASPPVPIHRLGRGTSGLVLLARSSRAKSHLTQQMRDRRIRKIYRALASGSDLPEQLTITQPIGKVPHPSLGELWAASPQGRPANSQVQVLQRRPASGLPASTLVEVNLHTGRPHQIRIHLAAAGYPLVGDPLYGPGGQALLGLAGDHPVPGDCGYHLHAYQLEFEHPVSGLAIALESRPPEILQIQGR